LFDLINERTFSAGDDAFAIVTPILIVCLN
jgi:hypothetical protein